METAVRRLWRPTREPWRSSPASSGPDTTWGSAASTWVPTGEVCLGSDRLLGANTHVRLYELLIVRHLIFPFKEKKESRRETKPGGLHKNSLGRLRAVLGKAKPRSYSKPDAQIELVREEKNMVDLLFKIQ